MLGWMLFGILSCSGQTDPRWKLRSDGMVSVPPEELRLAAAYRSVQNTRVRTAVRKVSLLQGEVQALRNAGLEKDTTIRLMDDMVDARDETILDLGEDKDKLEKKVGRRGVTTLVLSIAVAIETAYIALRGALKKNDP
jgi:hypothetical protein